MLLVSVGNHCGGTDNCLEVNVTTVKVAEVLDLGMDGRSGQHFSVTIVVCRSCLLTMETIDVHCDCL